MLKKRLVGVITVRNGWAVQSFGYRRYLPLGRPECLAENLDRWGADEILVMCIDRARRGLGPDLELVRRLGALGLSTPLTYGGGIRNVADAGAIIQSGADRLCVDALLRGDPAVIEKISELVGAQAVIGVLPLVRRHEELCRHDYLSGAEVPLSQTDMTLFTRRVASEALIVDRDHEGQRAGFDMELVRRFPLTGVPLIAFGGVSEVSQLDELLAMPRVVAAAIGNSLAYREHAIQYLKRRIDEQSLRAASFMST